MGNGWIVGCDQGVRGAVIIPGRGETASRLYSPRPSSPGLLSRPLHTWRGGVSEGEGGMSRWSVGSTHAVINHHGVLRMARRKLEFARQLRRRMTSAEKVLWARVV